MARRNLKFEKVELNLLLGQSLLQLQILQLECHVLDMGAIDIHTKRFN